MAVQERNTASHSYARLPQQRDREAAGRLPSGAGATGVSSGILSSADESDGARRVGSGRRPSSRNLYQRPNTNRQNADDVTAAVAAESGAAAGAPRGGGDAAAERAAASSSRSDRDPALRPGNSDPQARARTPVGASGGRRIRLRGSADSAAASSQLGTGNGDTNGMRPGLSLPNARGNAAMARQTLDETVARPGTGSGRPGSSAGLRPRTPSSSSWRPVLAAEQGSGTAQMHGGGQGRGGRAGAGSDDEDLETMPAEDPYVRLLREREREWRGRTLQMMSGGEDDDGASLIDRYVRLGR